MTQQPQLPQLCLSSTLLLQRLPRAQHIPLGAGLAPLAALGAQEEEQLIFLFFFPQAPTPPSPGLCPAEHPAHCQPRPQNSKGWGLRARQEISSACLRVFLHYRKEESKERQFSLPGSHCSNSESCRSREKPQL